MMTRRTPGVSRRRSSVVLASLPSLAVALLVSAAGFAQASPESTRAQAVFQQSCYGCHTAKMKGGLRVDSLPAMLKGGDSGPAVVPGDPDASLLLKAIRYKDQELQMPPKGKLPDADIDAVAAWIKAGAPDLPVVADASNAPKASLASAKEQYFENKVRPLLAANCYTCHTSRAAGGLRLDSRQAILTGGKDGPAANLQDPDKSLLLTAVHYLDRNLQMPPKKPLDPTQTAVLEQWIKDGMVWPAGDERMNAVVTDKDRKFWSYQVPAMPAVPDVKSAWAYNDIDRFLLAKMEAEHLTPVADADKRTLLRRVTFDLTGLPPTPVEINAFLRDKTQNAYEKVVDRLLASKAYGERWGRMWMDVVRYSDTTGEGADYPIPEMYKYRDYIVASFNEDKPYDRFIREQIAGDLLPYKSEPEHWNNVIATGYVANANRYEDHVSDTVDNIGYAYLGTSIACARCHDHKFDPIPTADYYGIYGIFASTVYSTSGAEESRYERNMVYRDPNVVKSQKYIDFEAQLKPIADSIHAVHQLPYFDDILPALEARRMALFANVPKFEDAYAVMEGKPHDEYIQHLGDKKNLGDRVPRHFLQTLGNWQMPADTKDSGRLELANWIASPQNPLTARVMVNRLWQGHFGTGIVATPNDFGVRGVAPSNQPLLDYLAVSFMKNGWSMKAMQREMVLSHAYRLSSDDSEANAKIDPDDVTLWRHARSRMDAEEIRDAMLQTSGLIDESPAGEHPFPAEGQWNYSGHVPFHAVYETNRRTLYVMTQRSRRHPYLGIFDGADSTMSVGTRDHSITPLQSLYFMNGDFTKQCAARLTTGILAVHLKEDEQINRAFLLIYGRSATKDEITHAQEFLHSVSAIYKQHGKPMATGMGAGLHQVAMTNTPAATTPPLADNEAYTQAFGNFIQALYASNEFMFLD
ncbi:PSD1 and planctomycete cytochrome C domain-containing protein [Granulicella cerasi]|uniref:PSD1 and planctomycete cytochrome C domain-containing protein n=1 Tax=Granulicella cerasi TaxID=741063 RepID=UPI00295C36B9|nr:DUF1553 domain-containing protein [Granulicella cerasi]